MDLPSAFLGLADMAAAAFGAPFFAGAIASQDNPGYYDDNGNWVPGSPPTERACRVSIDQATEAMRQSDGFADGDVRFIILAASFSGLLDTDASVKVTEGPFAGIWAVTSIERDPAGVGYVGRGRRA